MADNTLQFQTKVDLSGLNSGLDDATASVEKFGADTASAMDDAAGATKRLADAQIALGAAAAAGNEQAAAIIKQYQSEVDATVRSTQKLTLEQKRQYDDYVANARTASQEAVEAAKQSAAEQKAASEELTIAQKRQYEEYVAQQRAIMDADKSVLSSRMAIGAEARILEGSTQGATRAIAAYLSSIPALAAAAQAAFTGFALVAIGEIAFDVGKKIYDAFDMGGERVRKFNDDLIDAEFQFEKTQASLDVKLQKLIAERDHLEGRAATNGLALDLAEATQRALELDSALVRANTERAKALGDNAPSMPQRILGTSGTGDEQRMLATHNQNIKTATTAEAQLSEQRTYGVALTAQLNTLLQQQKDSDDAARVSQQEGAVAFSEDYSKRIEAVKQLIQWKQEDDKLVQTTQKVDATQSQVNSIKGVPKEKRTGVSDFMRQTLDDARAADAAAAQSHEELTARFLQDMHAQEEATRKATEADRERTEMYKKNQAEMRQAAQAAAQGTHDANIASIDTSQAKSANANQLSLVPDPQGQLNALRSFHAQAAAEDTRFIQEEIQIYATEPAKVDALEKQLSEVRRKADLQWLNDTKNISMQVAQAEQQALTKMQTEIATTFSKSLTGQQTWAQASMKLYDNVAQSFILNMVKMGEQSLVALALGKSIESQKIMAAAKGAAASSYDWASAWGGPIAGAIAGAAAFAGVLAFDSFEMGGIVAGGHGMPVPIMAHAGERVLSAPQTQNFEKMVNGGGNGGGNNVHLNYSPQVNAYDKTGMKSILQSHSSDIHDIVRSGLKSGALGRA